MVLFDVHECFENAVHCAVAMNTISQHIINKNFKANEVKFGIGIDYGRMLATKTGIRRHGSEQGNYRNLAWLGRPANVASKLTDTANKPAEYVTVPAVQVAYENNMQYGLWGSLAGTGALSPYLPALQPSPFSGLQQAVTGNQWTWVTETLPAFVSQLEVQYAPTRITHKRQDFVSFFETTDELKTREATPPILLTAAVWSGFKKAKPTSSIVQKSLFTRVSVSVPGYSGEIFGGRVFFPQLVGQT